MKRWLDALVRGVRAGRDATTPMTLVMGGARKLGILGEPPPRKLARELLHFFGVSSESTKEKVVALASHFAFGAAVGGVYGLLREAGVLPRGPLVGAAYGSAIWAASYFGWVPALTNMPSPPADRPLRPWAMLGAHWVYGAALDHRFGSVTKDRNRGDRFDLLLAPLFGPSESARGVTAVAL